MKMPCKCLSFVMPGHSRPKGRRALHAYVPGIHVLRDGTSKTAGRDEPGHDGLICPPLLPDLKLSV